MPLDYLMRAQAPPVSRARCQLVFFRVVSAANVSKCIRPQFAIAKAHVLKPGTFSKTPAHHACTQAAGSASFAESLYGLRRVAVGDKGADAPGAARRPLSRPKMRLTLLLLVRRSSSSVARHMLSTGRSTPIVQLPPRC